MDLLKVRDVSMKYEISTRALTYYEEMGLIKSVRAEDYSYRCYDEEAIKRLEQILILRKLGISIKDIVRIFSSAGAEILLELLENKVESINEQVFLLQDLKNIILDFIGQIERYDFNNRHDIKFLYEKTIDTSNYIENGNDAFTKRFMEITKKLEKSPVVSVTDFPSVKMAVCYDIGNDKFSSFKKWCKRLEKETRPIFPNYFEWFNPYNGQIAGLYPLPYGYDSNCPFDTFNFPGGLYASATFLDDPYLFSIEINSGFIYKWVGKSEDYNLYLTEDNDAARFIMWRPIPALGKEQPQVEFFIPIIKKSEKQAVKTLDIDLNRILNSSKIDKKHKIDLRFMKPTGGLSIRCAEDEATLYQLGQEGQYSTNEQYKMPLRIDFTAKTDSANIRIGYGKLGLVFNWGIIPSAMLISDIIEGGHYPVYGAGYIPPNEYAHITVILERDYTAVIVNGQVRFYKTDFPYIERLKNEPELIPEYAVRLNTAFGAEMTVKNLTVYELK